MSEAIEILKKPFGNLEGSNKKQKEIGRLRSVALDEGESATERLVAAQRLLSRFRLSRDNAKIIRQTIKTFISDPSAEVQARAAKLKRKFLNAKELKAIEKTEMPDESELAAIIEAPPSTVTAGIFAPEIPNSVPSLNRGEVEKIIRRVIGVQRYDGVLDVCALSISKQNLVIEGILHDLVKLELSPANIRSVVDVIEREGLDRYFPGLVPVGRRYERVTKELLDALNRRDGAPQ